MSHKAAKRERVASRAYDFINKRKRAVKPWIQRIRPIFIGKDVANQPGQTAYQTPQKQPKARQSAQDSSHGA